MPSWWNISRKISTITLLRTEATWTNNSWSNSRTTLQRACRICIRTTLFIETSNHSIFWYFRILMSPRTCQNVLTLLYLVARRELERQSRWFRHRSCKVARVNNDEVRLSHYWLHVEYVANMNTVRVLLLGQRLRSYDTRHTTRNQTCTALQLSCGRWWASTLLN